MCFLEYQTIDKVQKLLVQIVIHRRQKPLESKRVEAQPLVNKINVKVSYGM
jgi:hypothetical protein